MLTLYTKNKVEGLQWNQNAYKAFISQLQTGRQVIKRVLYLKSKITYYKTLKALHPVKYYSFDTLHSKKL